MAKKLLNRLGIKTRKQKIEDERKRQQRLEAQEAANANRDWTTDEENKLKWQKGRENVGDFKSLKAQRKSKAGKSHKDGKIVGTEEYKSGDKFYDTKDSSDSMSKMEQRIANRQLAKEGRKNRRAEKVAKRKGMSNQQAKDFMQNRRDRFRQMSTNFVKGLAGLPMDTKVDKRLMRKDGSGVLQNQIGKDGRVFDATAPYKGSAAKGFSDRGGTRDEVDTYLDLLRDNQGTNPDNKVVEIPENKIEENNEKNENPIEENNKEVVEKKVEKKEVIPNNYSNLLIDRNVDVDTIGLPNRSYLTHNESSQGKYNNPKNILNNKVDLSKIKDRNFINDTLEEINANKALGGNFFAQNFLNQQKRDFETDYSKLGKKNN